MLRHLLTLHHVYYTYVQWVATSMHLVETTHYNYVAIQLCKILHIHIFYATLQKQL